MSRATSSASAPPTLTLARETAAVESTSTAGCSIASSSVRRAERHLFEDRAGVVGARSCGVRALCGVELIRPKVACARTRSAAASAPGMQPLQHAHPQLDVAALQGAHGVPVRVEQARQVAVLHADDVGVAQGEVHVEADERAERLGVARGRRDDAFARRRGVPRSLRPGARRAPPACCRSGGRRRDR